jgi:hypothetical protein
LAKNKLGCRDARLGSHLELSQNECKNKLGCRDARLGSHLELSQNECQNNCGISAIHLRKVCHPCAGAMLIFSVLIYEFMCVPPKWDERRVANVPGGGPTPRKPCVAARAPRAPPLRSSRRSKEHQQLSTSRTCRLSLNGLLPPGQGHEALPDVHHFIPLGRKMS